MARIPKWTGIVAGSLVGLFILLIVLVGVFGSDNNDGQDNASTTRPSSDLRTSRTVATPRPTATQKPETMPPTATKQATAASVPAEQPTPQDSSEPRVKCFFALPPDYPNLSREEYESWLWENLANSSQCPRDLTEEEVNRELAEFERDRELSRRWHERNEHWENLDAFDSTMARIQEDRVVDSTEAVYICDVAPQWADQMQAAQEYAREFQRFDSDFVSKNPIISNLEDNAADKIKFIKNLLDSCATSNP